MYHTLVKFVIHMFVKDISIISLILAMYYYFYDISVAFLVPIKPGEISIIGNKRHLTHTSYFTDIYLILLQVS